MKLNVHPNVLSILSDSQRVIYHRFDKLDEPLVEAVARSKRSAGA